MDIGDNAGGKGLDSMKPLKIGTLASAFALVAGLAAAQSSDMQAMAQQFGQSAKQNAAALRMYSWTMRVEVTVKDETKPAKLFAMRFDPDGKVQKTQLTADAPQEKSRGLKGKIKAKKTAEFKEWASSLVDLCKDYLAPSPALLQSFFSKVLTAPAPGGWTQLYAQGVISPGDKLVYEIDPKTQALNRVLFNATLDGDPVDGTVEIVAIPGGGPNHAARVTINAPGKKLVAKIENYDYKRQ